MQAKPEKKKTTASRNPATDVGTPSLPVKETRSYINRVEFRKQITIKKKLKEGE